MNDTSNEVRQGLGLKALLQDSASAIVGLVCFGGFVAAGPSLAPQTSSAFLNVALFVVLFAVMLWGAFAVVRQADCLAKLLGEPYGTLVLTLAVISIEVALISAVMLQGADNPTLARDTMFAVLMIVLNGLIGASLLTGAIRHRVQSYNLQGANAFLAVLIPLAILGLVVPHVTVAAPGDELSPGQAVFAAVTSVVLYGVFLAIQTLRHRDFFQQPAADAEQDDHHGGHHDIATRSVPYHAVMLVICMLPIVLLSKKMAIYVDFGIAGFGAPAALGGVIVAALVLAPEGLSAIQAARDNLLQRSVNICLGSGLATIGLTIPAVLAIGLVTKETVELGLRPVDIVLLVLTLMVSMVTFSSSRTNALHGAVHVALFAAYAVLIFDR